MPRKSFRRIPCGPRVVSLHSRFSGLRQNCIPQIRQLGEQRDEFVLFLTLQWELLLRKGIPRVFFSTGFFRLTVTWKHLERYRGLAVNSSLEHPLPIVLKHSKATPKLGVQLMESNTVLLRCVTCNSRECVAPE